MPEIENIFWFKNPFERENPFWKIFFSLIPRVPRWWKKNLFWKGNSFWSKIISIWIFIFEHESFQIVYHLRAAGKVDSKMFLKGIPGLQNIYFRYIPRIFTNRWWKKIFPEWKKTFSVRTWEFEKLMMKEKYFYKTGCIGARQEFGIAPASCILIPGDPPWDDAGALRQAHIPLEY